MINKGDLVRIVPRPNILVSEHCPKDIIGCIGVVVDIAYGCWIMVKVGDDVPRNWNLENLELVYKG